MLKTDTEKLTLYSAINRTVLQSMHPLQESMSIQLLPKPRNNRKFSEMGRIRSYNERKKNKKRKKERKLYKINKCRKHSRTK